MLPGMEEWRIAAGIARARARGTRSGKAFGRPKAVGGARGGLAFAGRRGLSAPVMRPWRGSLRRCAAEPV